MTTPACTRPSPLRRAAITLACLGAALAAHAQEKVVFATNWKAHADHGGFYQALVDGTYKKYGLDVEIQQGGALVNNRPMLPAGKVDFLMAGNLLQSFDNVKNGIPTVVVAAFFQKDPQALLAHPGQGYDRFEDLARAPVAFIGKDGQFSFWQWMKSEHGFQDKSLRPYTFNMGPFLADKRSIQQGYAFSEPIAIRNAAGFEPVVHLLADHGFSTYATTIETRTDMVKNRPETVRRFIEASIIGWNHFLYGRNEAAKQRILQINPDASLAVQQGYIDRIKKLGLVDSTDSLTRGIGAIDPARVKDFHDKMVRAGLYRSGQIDLSKVVDTRFVNQGVGVDIRKQLTGTTGR
ncbi:NMT1/THI5 like [Delftia tsuruhatensis]|uniref:ABC transporter substrate-binding protein n=1 Tax=Delftia tsuruhatensis TaxID=180282 RepID=UPI001E7BCF2F|nr:ABC transporter substrate-binding protein [Delftia tsuruhatensis]CAB5722211.1 NMT1/THI5 like [Delftia tsuruhatensis]CAC9686559.1 NMT1/THI5 like [Delftia tsuruhatensis]